MGGTPIETGADGPGTGILRQILDLEDAILIEPELRAVSPAQFAARDAAGAVRRLIHGLAPTSASIEELADLAVELDRLTRSLADSDPSSTTAGEMPNVAYQAHRLRERSPFIGQANPVALPLVMEFVEGGIDAFANFSTLYEGPPGCLHGGYIAGIFDEVLGAAQTFSGHAGMTGRLTIHYRSPTPLNTDLHLRARLESVNGRKIMCKGTLHAGERLCAEAEGLFISVDPSKLLGFAAG